MSEMNPEQVVSIYSDDSGIRGSGYLLAPDLVITAGHSVETQGSTVQVRALRRDNSAFILTKARTFRVAVKGDAAGVQPGQADDFALLTCESKDQFPIRAPFSRPRLGQSTGNEAIRAQALGFPESQESEGSAKTRWINTEHAYGEVAPLSGTRADASVNATGSRLLNFQIRSGTPRVRIGAQSGWEGASGAALFCGDHLVGVLIEDFAASIEGRLRATPVSQLLRPDRNPDAVRCLKDHGFDVIELVWARDDLLESGCRELPSDWSVPQLLLARYGAAPFVGRTGQIEQLIHWCQTTNPSINVMVLTGEGAVGKTRLAVELCQRIDRRKWVAGFLSEGAVDVSPIARLREHRLVVVDGADLRIGQLDALLESAEAEESYQLRILAVARRASGWWDAFQRRYDTLTAKDPFAIDPPQPEERKETYYTAVTAFRELYKPAVNGGQAANRNPAPRATGDAFEAEHFENYFFILIQSLIDARTQLRKEGDAPSRPIEGGSQLYDWVLDMERTRWSRAAESANLPKDRVLLERVVGVATMAYTSVDADDGGETDAAQRLHLVPDLGGEGELLRRAFARWEREQYAEGFGYLRCLRPRRLAEHLVFKLLPTLPKLPKQLLDVSTAGPGQPSKKTDRARQAAEALSLLTAITIDNADSNWPTAVGSAAAEPVNDVECARVALNDALDTHFPALLKLAARMVASPTGTPEDISGKALVVALEPAASKLPPGKVHDIARKTLPEHCPDALLQLAVVTLNGAVKYLDTQQRIPDNRDSLAEVLRRRSRYAADLGHLRQAEVDAWRAVEQSRAVLDANYTTAREVSLAHALSNLGMRLRDLGRFHDSLDQMREAVRLYERLHHAQPSFWTNIHLAWALSNFSLCAKSTGRWQESYERALEADELVGKAFPHESRGRTQKEGLPETQAFVKRTLARALAGAGHHDEAIKEAETSLKLYRRLTARDKSKWRRDYARALDILGRRQAELAELSQGTRASWSQSVETLRKALQEYAAMEPSILNQVRLDQAAARRDLAASHLGAAANMADSDARTRALEEGWDCVQEALGLYESIPDSSPHRHEMALTLRLTAALALARMDHERAENAAAKSAGLYREVYEEVGEYSWLVRRNEALARVVLAEALLRQTAHDRAREEYRIAAKAFHLLERQDPGRLRIDVDMQDLNGQLARLKGQLDQLNEAIDGTDEL